MGILGHNCHVQWIILSHDPSLINSTALLKYYGPKNYRLSLKIKVVETLQNIILPLVTLITNVNILGDTVF
jgi:hypothetical protein